MKRFLLLMVVCLAAGSLRGAEPVGFSDGRWWRNLTPTEQIYWLQGFNQGLERPASG
jgi:hypothetical protein